MSGYKRVNFYELCRLCARNQQKEITHIFQEEGRKIQLQNKIQTCLSLKVCENDFLPKVVCSQCLRSLEESCIFRKVCYTSETMLSSYFNNFRYTEDFKKSGKVYIKDTTPTIAESITTDTNCNLNFNASQIIQEETPVYTLHVPPTVATAPKTNLNHRIGIEQINQQLGTEQLNQKIGLDQSQISYNLSAARTNLTGIAIDSNGDLISVAPMINVEAATKKLNAKKSSRSFENTQIMKSQPEKKGQQQRLAYTIRIDEAPKFERSVLNPLESHLNQNCFNPNVSSNKSSKAYAATSANDLNSAAIFNSNPAPTDSVTLQLNNVSSKSETQTLGYSVDSPEFLGIVSATKAPAVLAEPSGKPQDAPEKKHACDICQKTFKRREHLYQHVKLHTGFRPFKCENCSKSFMRKEHLLRHMTSHSGQKNFTCNICDKSFSRNDNLLKHKKIHAKQNSFTCEVCHKQFVMEHYYLAHKLTHESEKFNPVWGLLKAV